MNKPIISGYRVKVVSAHKEDLKRVRRSARERFNTAFKGWTYQFQMQEFLIDYLKRRTREARVDYLIAGAAFGCLLTFFALMMGRSGICG